MRCSILREIDVTHPAAKTMIELSRAQDEEVAPCFFPPSPLPCGGILESPVSLVRYPVLNAAYTLTGPIHS